MSRTRTLTFDALDGALIDELAAGGNYDDANAVIRAGLRLLAVQRDKLAALRAALIDGEESGSAEPFDIDAFVADKRSRA